MNRAIYDAEWYGDLHRNADAARMHAAADALSVLTREQLDVVIRAARSESCDAIEAYLDNKRLRLVRAIQQLEAEKAATTGGAR